MSKKANPTAIGVFIVAAALLCVFAVVIFDSSRFFTKKQKIVMFFDESVNGLDIGAPLKFKGVRIGQVTQIFIDFNQGDEHSSIPVVAEIDVTHFQKNLGAKMDITSRQELTRMIEEDGLRARLQQSSFVTGLLFIELNYYPNAKPALYVQDNALLEDESLPEVPTMPGNMAQMMQNISGTLEKVAKMDLAGLSEKANSILAKVDTGLGQIEFDKINSELLATLASFRNLAENKDLENTLANLRDLTGNSDLRKAFEKLGPLLAAGTETLDGLTHAVGELSGVTGRVDALLADDSPIIYQVNVALEELTRTLTSLRVLSDYLERNPSSLLLGKQEGAGQ